MVDKTTMYCRAPLHIVNEVTCRSWFWPKECGRFDIQCCGVLRKGGRLWHEVPVIDATSLPSFNCVQSAEDAEEAEVIGSLLNAELKSSHEQQTFSCINGIIDRVTTATLLEMHRRHNTPYKNKEFMEITKRNVEKQLKTLLETQKAFNSSEKVGQANEKEDETNENREESVATLNGQQSENGGHDFTPEEVATIRSLLRSTSANMSVSKKTIINSVAREAFEAMSSGNSCRKTHCLNELKVRVSCEYELLSAEEIVEQNINSEESSGSGEEIKKNVCSGASYGALGVGEHNSGNSSRKRAADATSADMTDATNALPTKRSVAGVVEITQTRSSDREDFLLH